jgi:ferredoxin-nitrite reductase
MRGLASIAERFGSGTIRLTVWQNLLISDIPREKVDEVTVEIEKLGLGWSATGLRAGLVACTGNAGCKFAASDTKAHALQIVEHLEGLDRRLELDQPVNLHLTGCPNSCAQHYIGDIGLLGTKAPAGDDIVEAYHVFVGGGYGDRQDVGREVYRDVTAADAPAVVERMLRAYLGHRQGPAETFQQFVKRYPTEKLREMFEGA